MYLFALTPLWVGVWNTLNTQLKSKLYLRKNILCQCHGIVRYIGKEMRTFKNR